MSKVSYFSEMKALLVEKLSWLLKTALFLEVIVNMELKIFNKTLHKTKFNKTNLVLQADI